MSAIRKYSITKYFFSEKSCFVILIDETFAGINFKGSTILDVKKRIQYRGFGPNRERYPLKCFP